MTRAFWILLKREFGALLLSPVAYVIFFFLSIINGVSFYQAATYVSSFSGEYTVIQVYFLNLLFWFCVMTLTPLLTMRLFSEEYRNGTFESLMTAPVTDWDVVLAKFCGALTLCALIWGTSLLYLLAFQIITNNQTPVFWIPLGLTYLMVLLINAMYLSIGIFASSLTRNQIIAAISSFVVILFMLMVPGFVGSLMKTQSFRDVMEYFFSYVHLQQFTSAQFDTRPLVYHLSTTAFFLFLTERVLVAKRLKS
jgi:ABC-2 type transport system permease protein